MKTPEKCLIESPSDITAEARAEFEPHRIKPKSGVEHRTQPRRALTTISIGAVRVDDSGPIMITIMNHDYA